MSKVTYEILDENLNSFNDIEKYSEKDLNLISNFTVNKEFNFEKHYIETHFYSVNNVRLFSSYDYEVPFTSTGNSTSTNTSTAIEVDPVKIALEYGFTRTDVKVLFHFLNDLYAREDKKQELYIHQISQDRTEILIYSDKLNINRIINTTERLKVKLNSESYFDEFWLNLGKNDLYIVTNIDTYELDDRIAIALKLYEPLPERYGLKDAVQLVEKISDSAAAKILADITLDKPKTPMLRNANFSVDVEEIESEPTEYFNYTDLFSYDGKNNNRELFSYIKDNSVDIGIDYSEYGNFINFSSAEERLKNFKYKIDLLEAYQSDLDSEESLLNTSSTSTSGSIVATQNLINGIISNFDHYEKHLYFESGSTSWPKTNSQKPFENALSSNSAATTWYSQQLTSASNYDTSNYDILTNFLPEYVQDDPSNNNGVLFTHMLGQHYDNLWVYTKALTDKYDADNRLDVGISKDLVQEAVRSMGIKLYNSKESSNDLFKYIINDTYNSGSEEEIVNTFVQPYNEATYASGSITFIDSTYTADSNSTITITSAYGNTVTYQASNTPASTGDIDSSTGNTLFYVGTSSGTTSQRKVSFKSALEGVTGHGSEFTVSIDGNTVNVRQNVPGIVGNIAWSIGSSIIGVSNIAPAATGFSGGSSTAYNSISSRDYESEVYKRIYHNIPLLLKSKGTERGLRALISCFGIPTNFLNIKTFGNQSKNETRYFGPDAIESGSIGRVKLQELDHDDYVLTTDKSIQKETISNSPESQKLEVGFSPSDAISEYLNNSSTLPSFNIDDYIGDPSDLYQSMYKSLNDIAVDKLETLERFNLKDFVRIFKFYDNIIFKMIKDFVPARAALDVGIIIKPHILNRSKAKSPVATGTRPEYSASIDLLSVIGSDAGAYDANGELIVPKHLKHIEHKWRPGQVGGVSDVIFKPNFTSWNGTSIDANDGEIVVYGTELYHPDGYRVDISERQTNGLLKTVATPYESVSPSSNDYDFYIMYSSESLSDRFPLMSTFGQTWAHQHFAAVDYNPNGQNSWVVRGNSAEDSSSFSPLPNDVIIAGMHQDGTTGITLPFYKYYKSLNEKLSGHSTTVYTEQIPTISGSVLKYNFDEAAKINGELSGSVLKLTDGELNIGNIFKRANLPDVNFNINFVEQSGLDTGVEILLGPTPPNGQTTSGSACGYSVAPTTFYADSATHPLPSGSTVYEDINLVNPVDGNNRWYRVAPPADAAIGPYAVLLNPQGTVVSGGDIQTISGSIACTLFDSTAPSGYVADWAIASINEFNENNAEFVILDGEAGTTYYATASDSSTSIYESGTISNGDYGGFTNRVTSGSFDVSSLADGDITLSVRLVDNAGNVGAASTDYETANAATNPAFYGDQIVKSTQLPSAFTVDFVHYPDALTGQTLNHNGRFRIKVGNLTAPSPTMTYTIHTTLKRHGSIITKTASDVTYTSSSLAFSDERLISVIEGLATTNTILGSDNEAGYFISASVHISDSIGNTTDPVTDIVLFKRITARFRQALPNAQWGLYTGDSSLSSAGESITGLNLDFDYYESTDTFPTYSFTNTGTANGSFPSNFSFSGGHDNFAYTVNASTSNNSQSWNHYLKTTIDGIDYPIMSSLGVNPNQATSVRLNFTQEGQIAQCVDPDTLVLLSTGEEIRAGELTVGTRIKSLHESTLEEFNDIVTRFKVHENVERVKIVFTDGYLICTPGHRLYLEDKGYFEPVNQIQVGTLLSHGKEVISIETTDIGDVIDITVEKNHTYISNGILSHNDKGDGVK